MAEDVASSLHGLTTRDTQLSALYEDLEAERTRVDSLVAELKEELATLPDPCANDTEVESRLEILRTAVVAATTRLDEIEAAASTREEAARSRAGELPGALAELEGRLDSIDQASHARDDAAASRAAELDGSLAELAGRLDAAEQEREAAAEQLRTADEVWLQERDWVRRQLDRLAVLHESASHATESAGPQLEELAARLDGVEAARDAVSSEIVRVFHALDAERTSLQEQLDALHDAAPASRASIPNSTSYGHVSTASRPGGKRPRRRSLGSRRRSTPSGRQFRSSSTPWRRRSPRQRLEARAASRRSSWPGSRAGSRTSSEEARPSRRSSAGRPRSGRPSSSRSASGSTGWTPERARRPATTRPTVASERLQLDSMRWPGRSRRRLPRSLRQPSPGRPSGPRSRNGWRSCRRS